MSVVVDVGLLSGKTVSVEADLDESGELLDDELTVQEAKLGTRTPRTLQLQMAQIQASFRVFAAILTDGSVVT